MLIGTFLLESILKSQLSGAQLILLADASDGKTSTYKTRRVVIPKSLCIAKSCNKKENMMTEVKLHAPPKESTLLWDVAKLNLSRLINPLSPSGDQHVQFLLTKSLLD